MKAKSILTTLLLIAAGLQSAWGQGFRVYKSDGTVAQFSLRTDSIVFYDGIGSDQDFGPFTPVNQCIAGTWYKNSEETVTFHEDGTTDYVKGCTYEFMPYQGSLVIFDSIGNPVQVLRVPRLTPDMLILTAGGSSTSFDIYMRTPPAVTQGTTDGHEWVDLGLPSGTLWATCNVGANAPEEYGDYFAWGETQPKEYYYWSTYKYCNGSENTLTKYCRHWSYGYNDFKDTLTVLLPEDDAATANWGENWQMPTNEQLTELLYRNNTTTTWITQNGVDGRLITSKSNNMSLFLPAAGCRFDTFLTNKDHGCYWSSTLNWNKSVDAFDLYFDSDDIEWDGGYYRDSGRSVRPVRKK